MRAIGAITIGHSPRPDLVSELRAVLGPDRAIVEVGALDELSAEEVRASERCLEGPMLVTRLRDGSVVHVGERFLADRVARRIADLEERTDLILLLCTGSFPPVSSVKPVLRPEPILHGLVRGIGAKRLAVLVPAAEQCETHRARWHRIVEEVVVEAASPYGEPEALEAAARRLARGEPDAVVMDCIGYTREMKAAVQRAAGRPAMLAISSLARAAAELVD